MNKIIKKIYLTGITGYVGNLFNIYLNKNGYQIINNQDNKFDISDNREVYNFFNEFGNDIDLIIHLGSFNEVSDLFDLETYEKYNVGGTKNVLFWSDHYKIPILYLSPIFFNIDNNWKQSKLQAEDLIHNYNFENLVIETNNIFSFYHPERSLLNNVFEEIYYNGEIKINNQPTLITNFEQLFTWLNKNVLQDWNKYKGTSITYFDKYINKVPKLLSITKLIHYILKKDCLIKEQSDFGIKVKEMLTKSNNKWYDNVKHFVELKLDLIKGNGVNQIFTPVDLGMNIDEVNFKMYFDSEKILGEIE